MIADPFMPTPPEFPDDTSGFYNLDSDGTTLLWGPNGVSGPGFEMLREHKDMYTYPVHGWVWCDSRTTAHQVFGLTPTS